MLIIFISHILLITLTPEVSTTKVSFTYGRTSLSQFGQSLGRKLNIFKVLTVERAGRVEAWAFHAVHTGVVHVGLWNYNVNNNSATFIGRNSINVTADGVGITKVYQIPYHGQLMARPGLSIGIHYSSDALGAVIAMSAKNQVCCGLPASEFGECLAFQKYDHNIMEGDTLYDGGTSTRTAVVAAIVTDYPSISIMPPYLENEDNIDALKDDSNSTCLTAAPYVNMTLTYNNLTFSDTTFRITKRGNCEDFVMYFPVSSLDKFFHICDNFESDNFGNMTACTVRCKCFLYANEKQCSIFRLLSHVQGNEVCDIELSNFTLYEV